MNTTKYTEGLISKYNWTFAKSMKHIPHSYIVRDELAEEDKLLYNEFAEFIKKEGYGEKFFSKTYYYINIGEYKYWVIGNILNRTKIENIYN
jgi:hypothetical protein